MILCDKEVAILIGPTLAIHLKVTWDSDVELFQWRLIWLIDWLVVDAWSPCHGIPGHLPEEAGRGLWIQKAVEPNQLETMTGVKIELLSSKYKTLNNKRCIVYCLD